jgi:hypothetical protein
VKVTASSTYFSTLSVTSAAVTLGYGTFSASAANPTLTTASPLQPGVAVTAVPDVANYGTTGITFKYQWQRSTNSGTTWTSISGATASKYTPVATDVTDQLRVVVAAIKTGFTTLDLTSDATTVQYSPDLVAFTPPSLVGTEKVGGLLTINVGVWNTPTLTYSYQWFRNSVLVAGVTGTTWTPTADSVGDQIVARVTASRVGYQPVTVTTQSFQVTPADAPTTTIAPVITKLASPANTYTVSTGSWNVDGLTYSYQWWVGDEHASGTGATSATFTADATQSGPLVVVITAIRTGYTTAVKTVAGPTLSFV